VLPSACVAAGDADVSTVFGLCEVKALLGIGAAEHHNSGKTSVGHPGSGHNRGAEKGYREARLGAVCAMQHLPHPS
jgi:hypothetical protein